MIVFGPWLPDQPNFRPEKASDVLNVVPHEQGYHPWPSWTKALDAPEPAGQNPLTMQYFIGSDGTIFNILGTQNNLYKLNDTGLAWEEATRLAGGDYATPEKDAWFHTQFDDFLFFTNGVDPPQKLDMPAGVNFTDLTYPAGPPISKYMATVRRFVVAAHLSSNAREVAWSGLSEPLLWTPDPVTLADSQVLPTGGDITGLVGGEYGVVFQKHGIQRMVFGGNPSFEFEKISTVLGSNAPRSIVQYGDVVFFLSTSGVKMIRAAQEISDIGEGKLDTWLFDNIDDPDLWRVVGTIDIKNKLYLLSVPIDDNQDLCDIILAYHWPTGEWGKIGFTNYLPCTIMPQASYNLDTIDAIIGNNIDSVTWSFDDPSLVETGLLRVSAINSLGELGFFSGPPMPALITTGDIPVSPGRKTLVRAVRPMFEGTVEGLSITPYVHDKLQDVPVPLASSSINRNGLCPMRANGRYHRFKVNTALGGHWMFALGIDDVVTSEMAK